MHPTSYTVPSFGIGEIEGPRQYITEALVRLAERIGLSAADAGTFITAGIASMEACIPLMDLAALMEGQVNSVPAARELWNLTGDLMLNADAVLNGIEHLETARQHQAAGGNVLLVQNHRSGADMLVMETLIRRHFKQDVCTDWFYMAGHVINLYLVPLLFSAALNRFQIFSVKYRTNDAFGVGTDKMQQQNMRAMRALRRQVDNGGQWVVYYPEGGRGTGAMKEGEPATCCIPRNIGNSTKPLLILPTYVTNTERLLPQARGINEFNELLELMARGTATCTIGAPVRWTHLLEANSSYKVGEDEWNKRVCDTLLALVARLGPQDQAGPYNHTSSHIMELLQPFPIS